MPAARAIKRVKFGVWNKWVRGTSDGVSLLSTFIAFDWLDEFGAVSEEGVKHALRFSLPCRRERSLSLSHRRPWCELWCSLPVILVNVLSLRVFRSRKERRMRVMRRIVQLLWRSISEAPWRLFRSYELGGLDDGGGLALRLSSRDESALVRSRFSVSGAVGADTPHCRQRWWRAAQYDPDRRAQRCRFNPRRGRSEFDDPSGK
jgi:hypothetical protein